MCLIVLAHRAHPSHPLLIAANRDERSDRPTEPMQLLSEGPPRVAGGRDLLAGGTWMAINEHGLVAGITNQRGALGRDGRKRSRGEIPLRLAGLRSAPEAAEHARTLVPADYNPCTLLLADGRDAFYLELIEGDAIVRPLPPGLHILENRALGAISPKASHVAALMAGYTNKDGDALLDHLEGVLADGTIPVDAPLDRPVELEAARVRLDGYGTRSSTLVRGCLDEPPEVWFIDGVPGSGQRERFEGLTDAFPPAAP